MASTAIIRPKPRKLTKSSTVLKKALRLIEDISGWCQGDFHKKYRGTDRYCAIGALRKARNKGFFYADDDTAGVWLRQAVEQEPSVPKGTSAGPRPSIVHLNDGDYGHSRMKAHKAIVSAYRRAIELAKAAGD